MNTGLSSHVFPCLRARVLSGAGDEEVFETKASPPAVAGPLIPMVWRSAFHLPAAPVMNGPALQFRGSRP